MIIALDSNIFIYALGGDPQFGASARTLISLVSSGKHTAVSSTLVLTEVMARGDDTVLAAMTSLPHHSFIPVDESLAVLAASIIRSNSKKLLAFDAVHLATAIQSGAGQFWTHDYALAGVTGLGGLDICHLTKG